MIDKTRTLETMTEKPLITPKELKQIIPLTNEINENISKYREQIINVLNKIDNRFLIITGPCSIDNYNAAIEYAKNIKKLQEQFQDKFFFIMRTYFEKPRTTIGWKGLLYGPTQNDSGNINQGLKLTRKLLIEINDLGIPTATEFLNPAVSKYIGDLISLASIGARTTESSIHRELASGLEMPIGLKNNTTGNVNIAINAIISANASHNYFGINENGRIANIYTNGNPNAHLILRGGENPNYDSKSIKKAIKLLKRANLNQSLIIDCSHGNSQKSHKNQPEVFKDIINQRNKGNKDIIGVMLESYLREGAGDEYGQSKTDECMSIQTTKELIKEQYLLFNN